MQLNNAEVFKLYRNHRKHSFEMKDYFKSYYKNIFEDGDRLYKNIKIGKFCGIFYFCYNKILATVNIS